MSRPVAVLVLAALGSLLTPHGRAQGSPSSAPSRAVYPTCNELGQILFAALGEYALPTDNISLKKPERALLPEGPPGESKLVPIQRNTAGAWHSGWKGQPPGDALVGRWLEAPASSVASCLHARAKDDAPLSTVFPNWSGNNVSPAERNRSYSWTFRVSNPVLDNTGTHALIFYEMFRRGGVGGGTGFVQVERTGSGWKKVGERLLSNF
jgi:hypothetical protein